MTRRGASEGSIRQRPNGLWEARYRGLNGRQRSLYAKTRREAQERLRTALSAADNGMVLPSQRGTVGAFLEAWLATSVEPRLRPTTAVNYATIVRLYLIPAVGRVPLAKLEPGHIQRMLAELASRRGANGRPLSPTTVRYVYAVLRIALGRALKNGLVVRNVATLVDPPPKASHEIAPLTVDEVHRFLVTAAEDRLGALYVTALGLGLRQGELIALRWQDVDFAADTLAVRHTMSRVTRQLAEPKTERARRTLVMPTAVSAALREHRRRQIEERLLAGSRWRDTGHVFSTRIGTPLEPRHVVRAYHATLARAGLPRQSFHLLRHGCATLLIERGVELAVVSRLLGHANLSTTADVYSHLTRGMQQGAADHMDVVLSRSTG